MPVITTSTFDPLKMRCNVRLQQGVPIVDADLNELDDVRKFEMRAYLKWFVGDGIPAGNDGFRIDPASPTAADDLIIRAGVAAPPAGTADYDLGLRYAGRAIVDGLDVIIPNDINYKKQLLFAGPAHGLPQIVAIPNGAGAIAVYLDVWERLVTATEDNTLILPGIGTESCARMDREWCVRTRAGNTVPQSTDLDYTPGHSYYLLSVITRPTAGAAITAAMLQDMRHTKLALNTLESRVALIEKLLLTPNFNPSPGQFTPTSGAPGAKITLLGTAFNLGTPSVQFGSTTATVSGTPTATQIQVIVPNLAPQPLNITVITAGGSATSMDSFQILPPAPTFAAPGSQFNPKSGVPGASVTLSGNNFNFTPVAVQFVGATTAPAALVGTPTATSITVSVPNVALGTYAITVQTAGGQAASADTYNVT